LLESLTETEIEHDGKRFVVRSAPRPAARLAIVILDKPFYARSPTPARYGS